MVVIDVLDVPGDLDPAGIGEADGGRQGGVGAGGDGGLDAGAFHLEEGKAGAADLRVPGLDGPFEGLDLELGPLFKLIEVQDLAELGATAHVPLETAGEPPGGGHLERIIARLAVPLSVKLAAELEVGLQGQGWARGIVDLEARAGAEIGQLDLPGQGRVEPIGVAYRSLRCRSSPTPGPGHRRSHPRSPR